MKTYRVLLLISVFLIGGCAVAPDKPAPPSSDNAPTTSPSVGIVRDLGSSVDSALVTSFSQQALVIGNRDYEHNPLESPVNDAIDMAATLKKMGFEVVLKTDLNRQQMEKAIVDFSQRLAHQDAEEKVAFFYYSGHAARSNGDDNYLLAINNGQIRTEDDFRYEAIRVEEILYRMERANNGVNIVVLDASRDNPYRAIHRDFGRGLAPMSPGRENTLIAHAADKSEVTFDGSGRNSLYTKHLLRTLNITTQKPLHQLLRRRFYDMATPEPLRMDEVFMQARDAVITESEGQQHPWISSLSGPFCAGGCDQLPRSVGAVSPRITTKPTKPQPSKQKLENCGFWSWLVGCETEQAESTELSSAIKEHRKVELKSIPSQKAKKVQQVQRVRFNKAVDVHHQSVTTALERYPNVECLDNVRTGQQFSVKVSFTEELILQQRLNIGPSPRTDKHSGVILRKNNKMGFYLSDQLATQIPITDEGQTSWEKAWEIEVELSAPGFDFIDSDMATITLPNKGDSEMARFRLVPRSISQPKQTSKISALLWHKGVYLARIVREVTIVNGN